MKDELLNASVFTAGVKGPSCTAVVVMKAVFVCGEPLCNTQSNMLHVLVLPQRVFM